MNEPIDLDIENVRNEAHRQLGRNIINISKIEAGLKYLLSMSQFSGDQKRIREQLDKNKAKFFKQTLGQLVKEFHQNVVVDGNKVETTIASENPGVSVYFNVIYNDPDFLDYHKRALSDIVAERNKLIHQDLALIDISCAEDYQKLINFLDEQNPRLLVQLEELRWFLETLIDSLKTLDDVIKSPEFRQYIQSNQNEIDA